MNAYMTAITNTTMPVLKKKKTYAPPESQAISTRHKKKKMAENAPKFCTLECSLKVKYKTRK